MDNFEEFKPLKRQTMEMAIKNVLGMLVPRPSEEIVYEVLPIINVAVWTALGCPGVMVDPPRGVCAPTVEEIEIPKVAFVVFDKFVLENQEVIDASKSAILNVSKTKGMTIVAISGTSFDEAIASVYKYGRLDIEDFIKRALSIKTNNPVEFCVNIPKLFKFNSFRQSLSEGLKKINIVFSVDDVEIIAKEGFLSSLIITYKKLDFYNISKEEYDYLLKAKRNLMVVSWDFMDRIFENLSPEQEDRLVRITRAD